MKKTLSVFTLLVFAAAMALAGGATGQTGTSGAADTGGKYKGAPWFAAAVANGSLPSVDKRLPVEPVVVHPGDGYGWYENGTYAKGTRDGDSPDVANAQGYSNYANALVADVFTGEAMPNVWKSWESNADKTVWTFQLREGLKWSDGQPYTADDVMFWHYDLQMNPEYIAAIGAAGPHVLAAQTKNLEKIDNYTLRYTLTEPNPTLDVTIAQRTERELAYAPAHYLKQFHSKYTDKAALDAKVKAAGFDTWMQLLRWSYDIYGNSNPEKPNTIPWVVLDPPPSSPAIWTANPYYFVVDELGQQLPYMEQYRTFIIADGEARTLRILQGAVSGGSLDLGALPLAKEAKAKGVIDFGLFPRGDTYKTTCTVFNMNTKDAFKANLFRDVRFRQAWSLFVPRDKINQILYQGSSLPTLGGFMYNDNHPWFEPTLKNSDLIKQDLVRANKLLDELLPNKDKDGFRVGPDGKPIFFSLLSYTNPPWEQTQNIILEDLKLIGFQGSSRVVGWGGMADVVNALDWEISTYQSTEAWDVQLPQTSNLIAPTGTFGFQWALLWWQWLTTDGKDGEEPPQQIKDNYALFKQTIQEGDKAKLATLMKEWYRRQAEQVWTVPHLTFAPSFVVVQPNTGNWNINNKGNVFAPGVWIKGQEY